MEKRLSAWRVAIVLLWLPFWIILLAILNTSGATQAHRTVLSLFAPLSLLLLVVMADAIRTLLTKAEFWLGFISVIIAFVAAELVLAPIILARSEPLRELSSYLYPENWLFLPHHYEGFVVNPNWGTNEGDYANDLGFRGNEITIPKPEGIYRIVALGGSTTYDTGVVRWQEAYPAQLERVLREDYGYSNIEVINAGQPDYSTWEMLINLEFRLLDIEPDLILIYENTNDVHARLVPPEKYRSDNSGRRRTWNAEEYQLTQNWVWRVPSRLFQQMMLTTGMARLPGKYIDYYVTNACTGNLSNDTCMGMSLEDVLEANPPIYYERNLRSMIGIARAHDIDVVLITWAHTPYRGDYASEPVYEAAFEEQNEVMRRIAQDTSTLLYDFVLDMPIDMQYWYDGRHMNTEGNHLRATLIAAFLDEAGILPND